MYPALHRLERAGLIRSAWSDGSGRRRRSYQLTPAGIDALADQRDRWREFSQSVSALLEPGPWPSPA